MKTKLYLTVFLLLFAVFGHAQSQPGDIDITFNSSGVGAWGPSAVPPVVTDAAQQKTDACVYNSRVYTSEDENKDKIIIVGRFISFNNIAKKYIARINADGTLDPTFSAPVFNNGYIYNLEILPDNKILIVGGFAVATGGVTYRNVMRLNANGTADNTFGTGGTRGADNPVHSIAIQNDGNIILGGDFSSYNATACRNVIRVSANGILDVPFNSAPGAIVGKKDVRSLAMQGNKIIVGGYFTGYTGYTRNKIFRLNADGTFDDTFNSSYTGTTALPSGASGGGGDGAVYDLYVLPDGLGTTANYIYVAGKFTNYNNSGKVSIVRLTANGDYDTTFNTGSTLATAGLTAAESDNGAGYGYCVFSIKAQPDGYLLLGGNFVKYNNVSIPKAIVRIKPTGAIDPIFISGTGFVGGTDVYQGKSVIRDILMQSDGKIVVGGDFESYNSTNRRMLARIRTRECSKAGIFSLGTWSGDGIPTNNTFYMNISKGTFTIPTGTHMVACELEIVSGAKLIIQSGASLTVNGIVMNNGTFTIENTGALVQVKDDTKNADLGAGQFTMNRTTSPLQGYDFVFWSSPVEDQTLHNLSPLTRFDKFYKFDAVANNWVTCLNGTETMEEGRGYIVRAPSDYTMGTFTQFPAAFRGRARNGATTTPIYKTAANSMNLVGNPYPSAIDAVKFLNDPANVSKIDGTILLWSHASAISAANPGPNQINYNSDDYIAFNKTGGLAAADATEPFAGKIAAGQAFFISSLVSTPVAPQPVATFNNTMRITGDNNVFYKTATANNDSRIWVNFYNAQGAFRQTLIGYMDGATDGIDRSFDGEAASANSYVNFYSIAANKNLSIQGRALPFNENQVIPMGYKTTIAGTFSIRVGKYDGLFNNQHVYIVDKLQNTTQEIKSGVYTFTTAAGTFNDRFEIKFVNNVLAISNPVAADSNTALVMAENSEVKIQSSETIESIAVYDITGKTLYNKKGIAASTFNTGNLNVSNQVILVTVTFENKSTLTKKVMVN